MTSNFSCRNCIRASLGFPFIQILTSYDENQNQGTSHVASDGDYESITWSTEVYLSTSQIIIPFSMFFFRYSACINLCSDTTWNNLCWDWSWIHMGLASPHTSARPTWFPFDDIQFCCSHPEAHTLGSPEHCHSECYDVLQMDLHVLGCSHLCIPDMFSSLFM